MSELVNISAYVHGFGSSHVRIHSEIEPPRFSQGHGPNNRFIDAPQHAHR